MLATFFFRNVHLSFDKKITSPCIVQFSLELKVGILNLHLLNLFCSWSYRVLSKEFAENIQFIFNSQKSLSTTLPWIQHRRHCVQLGEQDLFWDEMNWLWLKNYAFLTSCWCSQNVFKTTNRFLSVKQIETNISNKFNSW